MEKPVAYATPAASVKLPVLPCPVCDLVDTPVLGPPCGPHVGELRCQAGHHIKWAPKALLQPKEMQRMGGIARCIIVGCIGRYGVEMRYANSGTPCASLTVVVSEQGSDGRVHDLYVPCEVWGKKAESVGALDAGQLVLLDGKLARRKREEGWETIITAFDATPLLAPQGSLTGSSN